MTKQQLIKTVMLEVLPDECSVIGPHNLQTLCSGPTGMIITQHARNFSIAEVLRYVGEAVNFLAAAVTIWGTLRQKPEPPTQITQQFLSEVKKIKVKKLHVELTEDVKEVIISTLLKKLESNQQGNGLQDGDR